MYLSKLETFGWCARFNCYWVLVLLLTKQKDVCVFVCDLIFEKDTFDCFSLIFKPKFHHSNFVFLA